MYHLKVEHRDGSVKAKRLRRDGIIPATVYGRHLGKSVHIQIPLASVNHFLGAVSKGGTLAIAVKAIDTIVSVALTFFYARKAVKTRDFRIIDAPITVGQTTI